MSEWIDRKYAGLLSPRLERFSVKTHQPYLASFRCPICGDSKKNKWKTRGFLFSKKGGLFFKCHNCAASTTLGNLLKQLDVSTYKQYVMERYREGGHKKQSHANVASVFDFSSPKFAEKNILDSFLEKVKGTIAEEYLSDRRIPSSRWSSLYYVSDVGTMERLSDKYKDRIVGNDQRLVIPFYGRNDHLVGVTCRALGDSRLRYVTIRIDDDVPMIYNLNKIDESKTVYVTEGPIDSMFIDNACAVGNSDLTSISPTVNKESVVLVYDNQPRNQNLVQTMQQAVAAGFTMVMWPEYIEEKDINDMVMSGIKVQEVIENNTYSGLQLQLAFNKWKKV